MSISISGWVEIRWLPTGYRPWHPAPPWTAVIAVGGILHQNAYMFGSLFGVRNVSRFRPLAPDRGFPRDPSPVLAEDKVQLRPFLSNGELGQVEIWLSILVRKLLGRGNFTSTDDLRTQVLASSTTSTARWPNRSSGRTSESRFMHDLTWSGLTYAGLY